MTTIAGARAEIIGALQGAGLTAVDVPGGDPPYVLVEGDGVEVTRVVAGQCDSVWRLMMVGGAWDESQAVHDLDDLKQTTLQTLRTLDGWRVGSVGPDGGRSWQGAPYLTADVSAIRRIDL